MNSTASLDIVRKTLLFVIAAATFGVVIAPAAHAELMNSSTSDGSLQRSSETVVLQHVDPDTIDLSITRLTNDGFATNPGHVALASNFLTGDPSVETMPSGWFDASDYIVEPKFLALSLGLNCTTGNEIVCVRLIVRRAGHLSVSAFKRSGHTHKFVTDTLSSEQNNPNTKLEGGPIVAEPSTLAMAGSGVIGLAGILRRKLRA